MDDVFASALPANPDAVHWVRYDRLLLVWLRGAIDPQHVDVLDRIRAAAGREDRVVLDLSAVTFFGATALNFLSGLIERVYSPVIISGLPTFVREILIRSEMHAMVSLPVR
ncbi:STAS domain-containing protein [Cryptosporangium sp. NPDC048952]|uniref:STAS domain-containing protein n=1 Tax=Cryptosporangium sp. NPDC048952 TaxID=3363961 RepID=UPI00371E7E24